MSDSVSYLVIFGFGMAGGVTWGVWAALKKLDRIIALLEALQAEKPK
ncbi:MAG: hypothetical protein JO276_04230 [Sphingomonadaceae bacterium]|nr:hypothetical protein [Sphingomonadaceae bacterium]